MNVVVGATDRMNENFMVCAYAGDVRPEFGLKFLRNGFVAVFGAEDYVDGVLDVRVRHLLHLGTPWGSIYHLRGVACQNRASRLRVGLRLVSHLRRSHFCVRQSRRFRAGLTYAAPPALVRDKSGRLSLSGRAFFFSLVTFQFLLLSCILLRLCWI